MLTRHQTLALMNSQIVTPKNAIELVLARKAKTKKLQLYDNTLQKWLFILAVLFLILGATGGITAYFWRQQNVAWVALSCLAFSAVFTTGYQLATVLPEFMKLRNAEHEISLPLVKNFNDDIDLIAELGRDFEPQHLRYARDNFSTMAHQLRARISLLVGAVDKVGVIPITVTAYISGAKAVKDGLLVFGGVEWVLFAFIFLYLFALRMCSVAQWMDRIALLYGEALASKKDP